MQKFSTYFDAWLAHYYLDVNKVGAKGDFVTSVTTSSFFAATIAKYFLERIESGFFDPSTVWFVELGANRGLAIKDVIRYIASENPQLIKHLSFCAIEPQSAAQKMLAQALQGCDYGAKNLVVAGNIKDIDAKEVFIFANEVLDCVPCELLYNDSFAYIKNHHISWSLYDETLLEYAKKFGITKGEVPLNVANFIHSISVSKCEALFFDYGQAYPRNDFSLRVYQGHTTSPFFALDNLGGLFGQADLTYDVNFELWGGEFTQAGYNVMPVISQARALINFGLDSLIAKMLQCVDEKTAFKQLHSIKYLIAPDGFGERFKLLHTIKDRG